MGYARDGLIGALLCAVTAAGHAATYVAAPTGRDSNQGTLHSPWSLVKAAAEAGPGDTVELRGGVYAAVLRPRNGGTASAPLVFKARAGETPLIVGVHPDDRPVEIATDYVTLDGVAVKKAISGRGKQYNVLVTGDHTTIRNCSIVGTTPLADRQSGSSESGIRLLKPSFGAVIEGCEIAGLSHVGVHVGDGARRVIIRGNEIRDHYLDAIRFDHSLGRLRESLVEDNDLHGSLVSDGIQFNGNFNASSYPLDDSNCGTVIRRNRIYGNAENGIDLKGTCRILIEDNAIFGNRGDNDGEYDRTPTCGSDNNDRCGGMGGIMRGGPSLSRDVIIRRNVVYDNRGGIAVLGEGWVVYGNTIVANNRDFTGPDSSHRANDRPYFIGVAIDGPFEHAAVKNNLIGGHNDVEARASGTGVAVDIDGNLYFHARPPQFSYRNNPWLPIGFDDWRRAVSTWTRVFGDDASSRVAASAGLRDVPAAPIMGGRYDFGLLPGSPAIDAGVPLSQTLGSGVGRVMPVESVRYFSDGMQIVDGDRIRIDGVATEAVVVGIDQEGNRLTLDRDIAWSSGAGVHLAYAGAGPDVGALEYGLSGGTGSSAGGSAGTGNAGGADDAGEADDGSAADDGVAADGGTDSGTPSVAATARIDIFHAEYGRFDFTLTNDAASAQPVTRAVLRVVGTEFDALDTSSTLALSPPSLGSNNGVTGTVATVDFTGGLGPGASAVGRAGDFDPYAAPDAVDIVLTFADGAMLGGDFVRDGNAWVWSGSAGVRADRRPVTIEAESMTLDGYSVENGNRIRLSYACCQGTAALSFPGTTGRYDLTVVGVSETDGPARIEVAIGGRSQGQFTFAVAPAESEFVLADLTIANGERIEITGTYGNGAFARIDRLELTPRP